MSMILTDTALNVLIIAPLTIPVTLYCGLIVPIAGISPALSSAVVDYFCGIGSRINTIHACPVGHSKIILVDRERRFSAVYS